MINKKEEIKSQYVLDRTCNVASVEPQLGVKQRDSLAGTGSTLDQNYRKSTPLITFKHLPFYPVNICPLFTYMSHTYVA